MNESDRRDDKDRARPVSADSQKAAENQPDLTGKEYYGVGDAASAGAEPEQASLQFGDEAVEQPGGATPARDAAAPSRTADAHYAEGGFDPRAVQGAGPLEDRTLWDKAKDEVQSWVGDHDAEERRKADHERDEAKTAHGGDWEGHDDDTGWRDPVSPGKEAEVDHASKPKGDDAREEAREHRPGQFRE